MAIGLIVHGGAGRFLDDEYPLALEAVKQAVAAGHDVLRKGGSALDGVEAATRALEAAPILNAGRGATINTKGEVELDAMIQDGDTQKFGAVAGVKRIEHPVSLARLVMEHTRHHFLITDGAEEFALEQGMTLIPNRLLLTERQIKGRHAEMEDAYHQELGDTIKPSARSEQNDTVGAVALDAQGRIAASVSTGGIRNKLPGRVGDSPIAGAGGYADSALGGASSTGVGEGIMRSLLTFRAVNLLAGLAVQDAATAAIKQFAERWEGDGGIIMLDRHGHVGLAHNTDHMPAAWLVGDEIHAGITHR